jgi:hypothetical protein
MAIRLEAYRECVDRREKPHDETCRSDQSETWRNRVFLKSGKSGFGYGIWNSERQARDALVLSEAILSKVDWLEGEDGFIVGKANTRTRFQYPSSSRNNPKTGGLPGPKMDEDVQR